MQSRDVILQLKSQFARHGIPQQLVSDNAMQFSSHVFAKFAADWGFELKTSSPRFLQSNGLAERGVQTVKNILKNARATGSDPYIGLLQYRNTPVLEGPSPAQLLYNRRLRTKLPVMQAYLARAKSAR